jgi:flagellar hook-associated protein 3 FlgL
VSVRVPNSILSRTSLANIMQAHARLAATQERAASGLRINRPSDDPAGAARAATLRAESAAHAQHAKNVDRAWGRLAAAERALVAASDVLVRARELALQGANGTLDAQGRAAIAEEVAVLFDALVSAANERHESGWIFAGTASGAPAFSMTGSFSGGAPPTVSFDGDSTEIEVAVGASSTATVTLDGRRVFLGDADGDGVPEAGREDLFALLGDLWQALVDDDAAAVRGTLDRLERGQRQLELERARVGAYGARLENAGARLADAKVEDVRLLSATQDADTVQVLSDLVNQETALQAALEVTARILHPSLLDFLR